MDTRELNMDYYALQKPPNERSLEDIEKIVALTSNSLFFRKVTENKNSNFLHREACKAMTLKSYCKNDPILMLNQTCQEFYMLLQGLIDVYVPKKLKIAPSHYQEEKVQDKKGNKKKISSQKKRKSWTQA